MKTELHPEILLDYLDDYEEYLKDNNLCLEELSFEDSFDELREIVSRFIAKKPIGNHYSTFRCPTCDSRIRSGMGSSSHTRDDRCRKCGQLINWNNVIGV